MATEIDVLVRHLDAIAVLERRINALYAEIHPSDALRTIPGIGPHLAPVSAARIKARLMRSLPD